MTIQINDAIVKSASKCEKALTCLNNGGQDLCPVKQTAGKVHFVMCANIKPCIYKISFADTLVCTCPVRQEIYKRYHIQPPLDCKQDMICACSNVILIEVNTYGALSIIP